MLFLANLKVLLTWITHGQWRWPSAILTDYVQGSFHCVAIFTCHICTTVVGKLCQFVGEKMNKEPVGNSGNGAFSCKRGRKTVQMQ